MGAAHLDRVLVDDLLVRLRPALLVVHVPAEGAEERVHEFAAELGFVVGRSALGVPAAVEALDELDDGVGGRIGDLLRPGFEKREIFNLRNPHEVLRVLRHENGSGLA